MRRIAIATANRAERGILEPIIHRLQERKDADITLMEPPWYSDSQWGMKKPEVVLIPADRKEMVELAMRCYYAEIPIFHLWAGVGNTNTYDDLNRRVISSFSYLMLCESEEARQRLIKSGEEEWRIRVVGTTHGDDLKIDESSVPKEAFDLVLINPNPADPKDTALTLTKTLDELDPDRLTLWVEPNEIISTQMQTWLLNVIGGRRNVQYLKSMERPKFLGLMKNCRRYITNSSSVAYEFGIISPRGKVINPGNRNKGRSIVKATEGASDFIVDLLTAHPIDKAKLLKVYP